MTAEDLEWDGSEIRPYLLYGTSFFEGDVEKCDNDPCPGDERSAQSA
jgi:hypothetical protein